MTKLNKMGKVMTSDVLIIGTGMMGLVTALKVKQMDPDTDVLCLEKGYFGYNGKTTKAGHGATYMAPEDDVDAFCKAQVKHNGYGFYMNDQDALYHHTYGQQTYIQELEELGAIFAHEEDGSLHYHSEFEGKGISSTNIDLDLIVPLAERALGQGVRISERIYFTDLLKEGDRVIGAVGFHLDTLEFIIFRAKAVVLATTEFNPIVRGMFYSAATGMCSAYEAGAEFRNVEQSTNFDLCHRNTGNYLYGIHWVICNKHGENVFKKYNCESYEEIDMQLMRALLNEVKEGNYPFYADFSQLPQTSQTEGEGFNQGMLMPIRLDMDKFIFQHQDHDRTGNPEVSMTTYVFNRGLRTDTQSRTTVKNLWAGGLMTLAGSAYGGWVHGDGIGQASRAALDAAKSIAPALKDIELGEVDMKQVEFFKNRIYEPLNYKGKDLPYQVVHFLYRVVSMPEYSIDRSEESINHMLEILKHERENLLNSIYVPKGNGHYLSKAVEARTAIDMLEVMFTAFGARKESRGFAQRVDYPERDDKNWLKWVVITRGEDGRPKTTFEPIPMEKYKWKPEGWKPEETSSM